MASAPSASDTAQPPKKRRIADIFFEFRRNPEKLNELNFAIENLISGINGMSLRPLLIEETNSRSSRSFGLAYCATQRFKGVNNFSIGSVFSHGLHVLKEYVSSEKIKVPRTLGSDGSVHLALHKLLEFINPETAPPGLTSASGLEADLAVRLAQHLFSNLAVSSSYTVENHYQHSAKDTGKCPCTAQEPLKGTFGDTSFGCEEGWHGSPDIILDHLTVKLARDLSENDVGNIAGTSDTLEDYERAGDYSFDSSGDFSEHDVEQMKAQTIVFSFLQKRKGDEMGNYLIPCIGISKENVLIHFYDSVNDILLQSTQLDLYTNIDENGSELNYPVILFLWLTLNYRLFCSGPTEEMKKFQSNFFKHVGNRKIRMYENDVKRPCRVKYKKYYDGSWAFQQTAPGPPKEHSRIRYDEFSDDEDQD